VEAHPPTVKRVQSVEILLRFVTFHAGPRTRRRTETVQSVENTSHVAYRPRPSGRVFVLRHPPTRVSDQRVTGEIRAIGYQSWLAEDQDRAKSGHILRMFR
jgi:hypothetical protein